MRTPIPRIVSLVVVGGALSGCFGTRNPDARCDDVSEYQLSGSVPQVSVPDGLVAPTRDPAYSVPPVAPNAEAQLQERGAACLERPPDYFRKDPAAAPPAAPAAAPTQ